MRVVIVTAVKSAVELIRYQEHIVALVFSPVQYVLPVLFTLTMVSDGRPSDEHVLFVLAGTLMWSWLHNCMWSISDFLRREQVTGTLETVFVCPCSRTGWLLGGALGTAVFQLVGIVITAGVMTILFPTTAAPDWLAVIVLAGLALAVGWSLSLFVACLVMYLKESTNVLSIATDTTFVLSGATYPIGNLQSWAIALALSLPFTWAIIAVRNALLGAGVTELWWTIAGLVICSGILAWSGSYLFRFTERRVRQLGTLAQY